MPSQGLLRGLFLAGVALAFGLGALRYPTGTLAHAGPGLFPLLVSCLLFLVAVLIIAQQRLAASAPMRLDVRNVGLVLLGLAGFVVLSKLVNAALGIVALVFVSTLAGSSYSWKRNLAVSAVLLGIAFAFQRLLGLNLPIL